MIDYFDIEATVPDDCEPKVLRRYRDGDYDVNCHDCDNKECEHWYEFHDERGYKICL